MTEAGRGSGCPALRWAGIGACFRLSPPASGGVGGPTNLSLKLVLNFSDDDDDDEVLPQDPSLPQNTDWQGKFISQNNFFH